MSRRLRLISGLILFTYVATHLANHALGIISLPAMDRGRDLFVLIWRSLPGSLLLYGALLIHLGLAYWAIYSRRSLKLPPAEALQLILGLFVPPILVVHILGTRFAAEILGAHDDYIFSLYIYFVGNPAIAWRQAALLLIAWTHGCIGLHFWLRLKPWYGRLRQAAFGLALVWPLVSLFGFWMAGRSVMRLAEDPDWLAREAARVNFPDAEGVALIYQLEGWILLSLSGLLLLTLLLRGLRRLRRRDRRQITYPGGRRVTTAAGITILEASREAGIAHASVCGGRGRCSTCRVRVGQGLAALAPPSESEIRVLARIGAAPDVRLACQTAVTADLDVVPLLPPDALPRESFARPGYLVGEEREIAILFADLRGFTTLSEDKLPYDVVFILNRYFAAMGGAIEAAGGRVDKFIGDGIMALFGIDGGVEQGSREALAAARQMAQQLDELNRTLVHDLPSPLRMGIGIHSGAAIVGEMGYGRATSVTAIGDSVNTASRLEALTKEYGAQLVLSEPLALHAGVELDAFERHEIEVRGRSGKLAIRVLPQAADLPVS